MSNSPQHDEGVKAVAEYMAQDRPLALLIEPARPRTYPRHWLWDSPDVVSIQGAHRMVVGDYKRTRSDLMSQFKKRQVEEPRFGVGLLRSLFVARDVVDSFGGSVPLPPKNGLFAVEVDGSVTELVMPEPFSERNFGAETNLWEAAFRQHAKGPSLPGMRGAPAIQKTRGKRDQLEDLVKELGSVDFKTARRELNVGLAEFDRLVAGSLKLKRVIEPGQRESIVLAELKTQRSA